MIRQSYLVVLPGGRNIPCHGQTDEESVLVRCLFWPMHEYPCRASHEKIPNNEKASHIGRNLRHRVESWPVHIYSIQSMIMLVVLYIPLNLDSLSILTSVLEVILVPVAHLVPVSLVCFRASHSLRMPTEKAAHDVYEKDSF
jgi:hypothetical protein